MPTATPVSWHPYMACNWVDTEVRLVLQRSELPGDRSSIITDAGRTIRNSAGSGCPARSSHPAGSSGARAPWIGWAPMPPDDIQTLQSDDFNNGGFWTFMETPKFNSGCQGGPAPATQTAALLEQTVFVADFEYLSGIGVFVMPPYVVGPFVEIVVDFQPWPIWFFQQIVIDWTFVWNVWNVETVVVWVNCDNPVPCPNGAKPANGKCPPRIAPVTCPGGSCAPVSPVPCPGGVSRINSIYRRPPRKQCPNGTFVLVGTETVRLRRTIRPAIAPASSRSRDDACPAICAMTATWRLPTSPARRRRRRSCIAARTARSCRWDKRAPSSRPRRELRVRMAHGWGRLNAVRHRRRFCARMARASRGVNNVRRDRRSCARTARKSRGASAVRR